MTTSPPKWTPERLLTTAAAMYQGVGVDAAERRRADKELIAFQHSDAAVGMSMMLLGDLPSWGTRTSPEVFGAVVLLLSQTILKRLQRPLTYRGSLPAPEDLLQRAEVLYQEHRKAAEILARSVALLWLGTGAIPNEILTVLAASGGKTAAGGIMLGILRALPEEAANKEVIGEKRAEVTQYLASTARPVLEILSTLHEAPAPARLATASAWLSCDFLGPADAALTAVGVASSPLLGVALHDLSPEASDFLTKLLKATSRDIPAASAFLERILVLLPAASDATTCSEDRRTLSAFLAEAATSYGPLFVTSPPGKAWEYLLLTLLRCSSWGLETAAATLPAWTELYSAVQKANCQAAYAPVFEQAVAAYRKASCFSENFEVWPADEQADFREFRDELRDALRRLVDSHSLSTFVRGVCRECLAPSGGSSTHWIAPEEALHALSAVAALASQGCSAGILSPEAFLILETLDRLAGESAQVLTSHRQLLGTFLVCCSVYVPVLALPHRPGGIAAIEAALTSLGRSSGEGCGSQAQGFADVERTLGRVLDLARRSLEIPQEGTTKLECAYPFRAKQDHAGAVCILKFCMCCDQELARDSAQVFQGLREEHLVQLTRVAQEAQGCLPTPALLVLTQALSLVAKHRPDLSKGLLADVLGVLRLCDPAASSTNANGNTNASANASTEQQQQQQQAKSSSSSSPALQPMRVPLPSSLRLGPSPSPASSSTAKASSTAAPFKSAAEVLQRCKGQSAGLGQALEGSWNLVAKMGPHADAQALGAFLAAALEATPSNCLSSLCGLAARSFRDQCNADSRLPFFTAASALAHRVAAAKRAGATEEVMVAVGLLQELLEGFSSFCGSELGPAMLQRAAFVLEDRVHTVGSREFEGEELLDAERSLLEAWSRAALEVGRHSPECLTEASIGPLLHCYVGALAVPSSQPPPRLLAVLAENWTDEGLKLRFQRCLGQNIGDPGSPVVASLLIRGFLKGLLGQMPVTALGVLVPAIRGLLLVSGPTSFASWLERSVEGSNFPLSSSAAKPDAKARFVRELPQSGDNANNFKQLLKRFCHRP